MTAAAIETFLPLGRKVMTSLDSALKSRVITFLTKVHIIKAVVFPVVMYGCERWIIRIVSTEELALLNCGAGEDSWGRLLEKTLESPLDSKESKLVNPKGNQP